jgi:hypothetical protein
MSHPVSFSKKGIELIQLYSQMADKGYERTDGEHIENAFSDFELRPYRQQIKPILKQHNIRSILDYGCGGSDWTIQGFDEDSHLSAKDFFELEATYRYEPARNLDERQTVDCVVSFDVLEHIFVADVPNVLRDMFSYASQLLVLNVACYPAAAKLPNGENAHITVRPPLWWKGMVDCISAEFPHVTVWLICSTGWRQSNAYPTWSAEGWQQSPTFVTEN